MDGDGTYEPAGWRGRAAVPESNDVCTAGKNQDSDAAAHRRCRHVRAPAHPEAVHGSDQGFSIGHYSRSRPFVVLGEAGDVQSRDIGVHWKTLAADFAD